MSATTQLKGGVPENIVSFVEETCHTEDCLRAVMAEVVFKVQAVGRTLHGLKEDFRADFGVYYDPDDSRLVAALQRGAPAVDWTNLVYHRWPDQSRIHVLSPDTGRVVAEITVRRYTGRAVSPGAADNGEHGPNVISWAGLRARREYLGQQRKE